MGFFKRKKKEEDRMGSDDPDIPDDDFDIPDDGLSNVEDELDTLEQLLETGGESDEESDEKPEDIDFTAKALENLDVEGHWNKKFTKFEDYLNDGGLMTTVKGKVGKVKLIETITKAEQDILGIKLSMVSMKEGIKLGRQLINQFRKLRSALGTRTYARLILALRYSCTKETEIGFHEPSFSQWDLDEEWVDEEYRRRLQGIDVASCSWKKGVAK